MAKEEILYSGSPVTDIAALIEACQFPEDTLTLFMAETLPQRVVEDSERRGLLLFTYFSKKIPFAAYTSGRIFHPDFELRWEKEGDQARVVYIGDRRNLSPLREVETLGTPRKKHYYLFGKRLRPAQLQSIGLPPAEAGMADFAEVRIPRLLRYPAPADAQRLKIVVHEYVQEETGEIQLFRFHSIEPE